MEAYESGALQFLNKPVGASELITAVKQLLALDELAAGRESGEGHG